MTKVHTPQGVVLQPSPLPPLGEVAVRSLLLTCYVLAMLLEAEAEEVEDLRVNRWAADSTELQANRCS